MVPDERIDFEADYDPVDAVKLQRLGSRDPTFAFEARAFWRSANTPDGPVTIHVVGTGARIVASAWGPGSGWALARVPRMCGADDPGWHATITPPWLDALLQQLPTRLGRALRVPDLLPCVILQQRVRFAQASQSWTKLVRRVGAQAPGPTELYVPPTSEALRSLRVSEYAAMGVDAKRARTLRACAPHAAKLDRAAESGLDAARTLLPKLPGVGPWTASNMLAWAFGDPDAVPTGDFHLANDVAFAFKRQRRGTDAEMLALLEPYRGNRQRVIKALMSGGPRRPRGGPRMTTTAL